MCDVSQEKGELEDKFWRSRISLSILPEDDGLQYDKELKTMFLKLFAVCIKYIKHLNYLCVNYFYNFSWLAKVVMIKEH